MLIYVAPVSGGSFAVQLGFMLELTEQGDIPEIILGSSGGNVSAYLYLALWNSDWNVDKLLNRLLPSMFASSWWPYYLSFMPSGLIGCFRGSLYATGTGSAELFKEIFTGDRTCSRPIDRIQQIEIWSGTKNLDTGKNKLFCNRAPEQSRIQPLPEESLAHYWNQNTVDLAYMKGDVEMIAHVVMASSAIPTLVPEKSVQGQRLVDGGTSSASPLSSLREQILAFPLPIHLNYLSSFDLQSSTVGPAGGIYQVGLSTIAELVKSLCVQDRLAGLEIVRHHQQKAGLVLNFYSVNVSPDRSAAIWTGIQAIRTLSPSSLLELSPISNEAVDLLSFTPLQLKEIVTRTRQYYHLRFWWAGTPEDVQLLA